MLLDPSAVFSFSLVFDPFSLPFFFSLSIAISGYSSWIWWPKSTSICFLFLLISFWSWVLFLTRSDLSGEDCELVTREFVMYSSSDELNWLNYVSNEQSELESVICSSSLSSSSSSDSDSCDGFSSSFYVYWFSVTDCRVFII